MYVSMLNVKFTQFMKDYYKILHIAPNASEEEIEKAHKQLSDEYQPQEHYPEGSFTVRYYKEVQEAYKVLSNPIERKAYDRELEANREQIEDFEKRQREEGFGDVLKLLLNDPKSPPAKRQKKLTGSKSISTKPSQQSANKPMIAIIVVIVLLSITIALLLLNKDSTSAPEQTDLASSTEAPTSEAESKSLLRENLYGTTEENIADIDDVERPYELNHEVSEEMASFSLEDCFQLLSNERTSFEKKEDAIARALQFFEGNNTNVIVLSRNNVQIRRETIEDYLFILMLQGYNIEIINAEKNQAGKITQLSVKELL